MADQCIIIEGSVKYRDGRKWKPRWCVMRKLSPVADCVHLLLYRDARARWSPGEGGAGGVVPGTTGVVKAALSLARCVGLEALDAADGAGHRGMIGAGGGSGAVGGEACVLALLCRDAVHLLAFDTSERLLQWQRAASVALRLGPSFPVRVGAAGNSAIGVGAISNGVLGNGAGGGAARLHVSHGAAALSAGRPPRLLLVWDVSALRRFGASGNRLVLEGGAACGRGAGPHVLLTDRAAAAAAALRAQAAAALNNGGPLRPDSLRLTAGGGGGSDTSLHEAGAGGSEAGGVLARCRSCMSKLGAPPAGTPFSPAWTMPALPRSCSDYRQHYDVPRLTQMEGEYYDTPKRLKECLGLEVPEGRLSPLEGHTSPSEDGVEGYISPEEGSRSGRGSPELTCIEQRPCGCVVRRRAAVASRGEGGRAGCACRRVTDWAQGWLRRRVPPAPAAPAAVPLYATVDLSRKSRRPPARLTTTNYENVDIAPLYENGCALRGRLRAAGAGDDYLLMEPRVPPTMCTTAGYAPMSPPGPPPPRRASSPDVRGGRASSAPAPPASRARDSSSSADSGVSLCSPPRRSPPPRPPPNRRSRSSDGGGMRVTITGAGEGKSSSAEAEVPVRRGRGAGGESSSASDTSDYIETLSLCSSHSSGPPEPPLAPPPLPRAATTLRPRAGAEYRPRPSPSPSPSLAPAPVPHARY